MRILLSIHNTHIQKIKSGHKKFEFRKVEAKKFIGNEILIYATSPISKVVGIAKIRKTHIGTPDKIWKFTKEFSGVNKNFYYQYYDNKNKAIAYEIESFIEFSIPKELSDFGVSHPPQSFIYIK
ncbi:hypothetical protein [Mesoplasma corruscae]|uniref:ASCH domain-containing protein n=1 Tax=Mesoplasma corruscae TaxID=216874 RepID=A0A2S5RGG8_9MOLU|nr:hypothetical protein [Mesoplasma corruscae]PPE06387.1 hypothetical protein MCORR_v1c00150 [Mesoplasma corruscae]